jgi:hypothetical protein
VNLGDTELQQTTGFPIVRGQLSIGSEADMKSLGLPRHDRVLLPTQKWPFTLFAWPVTTVARDDDGFFITALGEYGLMFDGFTVQDIGNLSSPRASKSFARSGLYAGDLVKRAGLAGQLPKWELHTQIDSWQLKAEYGSAGLFFEISGQFGTTYDAIAAQGGPNLNGKSFSLSAIIPWETLVLKDFPGAVAYWKFLDTKPLPSRDDSTDRTRNPRRLQDLVFDAALGSPLVRGELSLGPESALPPQQTRYATSGFLRVQFGESISFSDAPRVEMLDNGFASSSISIRGLTIAILGRSLLEQELSRRDLFSLRAAGDALGLVAYAIDDSGRVMGNMVRQRIRTISLHMSLGNSGLEISADGELNDLEPAENPRHREHPNFLKLNPIRTYALETILPWALLAARGLRFADRVRRF